MEDFFCVRDADIYTSMTHAMSKVVMPVCRVNVVMLSEAQIPKDVRNIVVRRIVRAVVPDVIMRRKFCDDLRFSKGSRMRRNSC